MKLKFAKSTAQWQPCHYRTCYLRTLAKNNESSGQFCRYPDSLIVPFAALTSLSEILSRYHHLRED